jgi:hypothetical protein
VQDDLHPARAEREVSEPTLVAGVNPRREIPAGWARHVAGLRLDPERHQVFVLLDAADRDGSELRQKRVNTL